MKQLMTKLKALNEISIHSFLKINIWFIPVAVCSVLGQYHQLFFTAFFIASIHELSHVLCAKFLKINISHITIYPFGICANLASSYTKRSDKEFLISFAGPFSNLIMFWIFRLLSIWYSPQYFQLCADINLAMCSLNLIPALPLDGGRMIKSVLSSKYGIIRSYNAMIKISRFFIIVLTALSVVILLMTKFNFSLLLISAFLFHNLSSEQSTLSHIVFKEILENENKLKERPFFPVKFFCVQENERASDILRLLSYDYFCLFGITDSNHAIRKTVTESEVLCSLTQKGIRTRFSDL